MVLGWKIFVHALRMVFGNFTQMLRIVAAPVLIGGLLVALAVYFGETGNVVENANFVGDPSPTSPSGRAVFWLIAAIVSTLFAMLWVAVAWHRYILIEEMPGKVIPALHVDRILAYLARGFLVTIVLFAVWFRHRSSLPRSRATRLVWLLPVS
jgi:hypothetical protein